MNLEKHLFICTRCKTQTGEEGKGLELQQSLKKFFKENHPEKSLRINKSGCLGKCSTGINAVCYPEGEWFKELSTTDEKLLQEKLLS